ncbi:hypothetical protein I5Q34_06880 [Streptomyces sp. AV19]|uniref:hypothetical protein n=1 Tax=Streptomyces sp. AV19 TaxID=2793068 RepID=UPI0018FEE09F|nr:hypothetical protein [Streptomyces sp. AV19]MBH1934019.1 hypothetical protein [Streptomyces sp. AV19]MDG4535497.1 hypothetical protein [Streptomyces sp. AV19]
MLSLRLARGAHPLVLLRRVLVTAAAAGVGFLLLCSLGYAVTHPARPQESVVRLLWCAVPFAAAVQFALAVARTDPATRPRDGLDALGLGPVRLSLLAAGSTALTCAVGSGAALLVYLELRGDLGGTPLSGAARKLLDGGHALPWAGTLTLLGLLPAVGAATCALVLRPREARRRGAHSKDDTPAPALPVPARPSYAGLPWGVAIIATGLALEAYVGHAPAPEPDRLLALPGRDGAASPGLLGGWLLASLGLVLSGPGLTYWCGVAVAAGRPGPMRLLAGRMLQDTATRIGRPLGVLCAVASGALAAAELYGAAWEPSGPQPFGPLTGLGAAVVMACVTATAITAALDARQVRSETTTALLRLGIPASLLRGAAAVRATVLVSVLAPLTWVIAELTALPLLR